MAIDVNGDEGTNERTERIGSGFEGREAGCFMAKVGRSRSERVELLVLRYDRGGIDVVSEVVPGTTR